MINLDNIKKIVVEKQSKQFSGLPLMVEAWRDFFPSIEQGYSILVQADSGIGKTTFVLDKFIFDQINFLQKNPNFNAYFSYFSLEETSLRMDLKVLGRFWWEQFGEEISIADFLNSNGKQKIKGREYMLDDLQKYVSTFNRHVEVIEDCKSASEIKLYLEKKANELKDFIGDPNFYWVVIIDNLKFIKAEEKSNKKDSIDFLVLDVIQRFRKEFSLIPIIIQHTNRLIPKYDFRNKLLIDSVKPSLLSLGESAYTQDPATHVIGLFSPERYGVEEYPLVEGHDIRKWKHRIRFAEILKGRDGGEGTEVGFFFNGCTTVYKELPSPKEFKEDESLYTNYGIFIESKQKKEKKSWENI